MDILYIYIYIHTYILSSRIEVQKSIANTKAAEHMKALEDFYLMATKTIAFDNSILGLSPMEPTRAASLFLVHHTARAASGRLVPTHIRSLAAAAVRETGNPMA